MFKVLLKAMPNRRVLDRDVNRVYRGAGPTKSMWYRIREREESLWWSFYAEGEGQEGTIEINDVGYLDGGVVTPEDAMAVTGLDHPMAAMDKLREMVHEAAEKAVWS